MAEKESTPDIDCKQEEKTLDGKYVLCKTCTYPRKPITMFDLQDKEDLICIYCLNDISGVNEVVRPQTTFTFPPMEPVKKKRKYSTVYDDIELWNKQWEETQRINSIPETSTETSMKTSTETNKETPKMK